MLRIGIASGHLVHRSTTVRRWLWPAADTGNGPTRSTWTCANRTVGRGIWCTAVDSCTVTFPLAQEVHSLHHSATSDASPVHTKRLATILLEALMPGCASPCTARKTFLRSATGTSGLSIAAEVSHHNVEPETSTCCTFSDTLSCIFFTSGQLFCFSAISTKSTSPPGAGSTAAAGLDSASATTLSAPGMCRISDVNSAT